jgi:hypothetical protein
MIALAWLVPVVLVALLVRGIFFGYPPPSYPEAKLLRPKEQAIVAACADALFPPGGPIPVSGTEAGLVAYLDAYIAAMPPTPRLLGRLLFQSIEHSPWIFGPRRVRFTRLRPEERTFVLKEMYESRLYFRRVSALSMRAMMTMAYLSHPKVAEAMGMRADLAPFEAKDTRGASSEVYA